jgi:hypothetical protein
VRQVVVGGLLIMAAVTAALMAVGWVLVRARPSWWRQVDVRSPEVQRLASAVENGLITAMNDVRPADGRSWSIRLDEGAMAAWLAARLPSWAVSQGGLGAWPSGLERVQACFREGEVVVGAELRRAGASQHVSIPFRATVGDDGVLRVVPGWVRLGRLALPTGTALGALGVREDRGRGAAGAGGEPGVGAPLMDLLSEHGSSELVRAIGSGRGWEGRVLVPLADGRRAHLVGVVVEPGALVLRWRDE